MTVYLDTNVLLWLLQDKLQNISATTLEVLDSAEILISPMVLLELEYLHEIERTLVSSQTLQFKMDQELRAQVCDLPFASVAQAALSEKWTRDPFDRIIVAQAKARGLTPLISADKQIRKHYSAALW